MISRRLFLAQASFLLTACIRKPAQTGRLGKLVVGTVGYDEGEQSVDQYQQFVDYLEGATKTLIEFEPAFNEVQAIEQVQRQAWSLVFAPPGLAAIAVAKAQYLPLFPLQGINNLSSVLVVIDASPVQQLADLNGESLALGQRGSATGYYVPLYELYGTTLSEIRITATPKAVLEAIANGEVTAGAVSKDEFDRYRSQLSDAQFRILHTSRRIPSGSVLVSPNVDRNQQALIQKAMSEALPAIAQEAGYLPNAQPPNYETLIEFIQKVEPIEARIQEKPAPLYVSEGAGSTAN